MNIARLKRALKNRTPLLNDSIWRIGVLLPLTARYCFTRFKMIAFRLLKALLSTVSFQLLHLCDRSSRYVPKESHASRPFIVSMSFSLLFFSLFSLCLFHRACFWMPSREFPLWIFFLVVLHGYLAREASTPMVAARAAAHAAANNTGAASRASSNHTSTSTPVGGSSSGSVGVGSGSASVAAVSVSGLPPWMLMYDDEVSQRLSVFFSSLPAIEPFLFIHFVCSFFFPMT